MLNEIDEPHYKLAKCESCGEYKTDVRNHGFYKDYCEACALEMMLED